MLIAKIINPIPVDYRDAFPSTSFPLAGPSEEFLASEGYAKVNAFKEHDRTTQKLVTSDAYYEAPWVYTVCVEDKTPEELAADQQAKDQAAREETKRKRTEAVANIKVTTTAGNTFDGDEESQTRMSRAIVGMLSAQTEQSGAVTLPWVLADNSVIQVDSYELTEALTLAGNEQAKLWIV